MLKIILFLFLFFFIVVRLGGFLMRLLFGSLQNPDPSSSKGYQKNADAKSTSHTDGKRNGTKNSNAKGYQGGEYIDYEELE